MTLEKYRYSFNPVKGYWITSFLVKDLENKNGCFKATLDIGLSKSTVCVEGGSLRVDDIILDLDDITPSEEDRVVIYEPARGLVYEVICHTSNSFYKLKAIALDKAPTLEISGIHMHRITNVDPWKDTLLKIRATRIARNNLVLDTCMGLGYTAIVSLMRGAKEVHTFEVDKNVVWIAERNPWSRRLGSTNINIFLGNVVEHVYSLPDAYFDRVIHDPPRFTRSTGDLYGLEFYKELYRVMKPRGILFHYTGEPRKHGGPSILKGIKTRLEKAGLRVLYYDENALGYVAVKP